MDFSFNRFSPRSFERFAQALTVRFLGPGVKVYGDGADGAREASFQGKLDFPSRADGWDGYTIVQAKFLQSPGSADSDAEWTVHALREELNKFVDDDRQLRRPEYYLLVTNARLSPVPKTSRGRGGIEKVNEVFAEYATALGLKGFEVWHYDELCARLADAEEIRRAHAAWITPSDVLASVMDGINFSRPDFGTVMHRFLQREIRNQRTTRLQQAGHGGGDKDTNLEDVFVDLPFVERSATGETSEQELLLANLLRRSRLSLSPTNLDMGDATAPRPDRLLLLGGPGQGKSTVSQLLAQLLRASLLRAETSRPMTADVVPAVRSILDRTAEAGLADDMPRRFPIRVELPLFADALSSARKNDRNLSLLDHIRDHIAEIATEPDLQLADLRLWLGAYPFLFLLDGLDEVPPSANRSDVIGTINAFWDELASVNADALMVVTTRPQGYNDDLDPALYGKLEMSKLGAEHALAYATKLANARLLDPSHRKRVLDRMTEAAAAPTTARLLVSPLQVAIMLALIDQRGEAPSDRWTLFAKYFNVVLEREQQKPGASGRAVKKWSRTIEALHQAIGFALHLQAESRGGSDAQLARSELEFLVRDQLAFDGFKGPELDANVHELLEATTDRLVLLAQRVDQRYSFEVRSLQEFMAAAFLMAGPEVAVQDRLREISNKSHWRHVFQIAASKCFSSNDTLQYRDTIVGICRELDTGEPADAALKSGARLALSLLEDGLATDTPKWRRNLLLSALEAIHAGVTGAQPALVASALEDRETTETFLKPHLRSASLRTRQGAWRLLLSLAADVDDWATGLLEQEWPVNPNDQLDIMAGGYPAGHNARILALYERTVSHAPILETVEALNRLEFGGMNSPLDALEGQLPFIRILTETIEEGSIKANLRIGGVEAPLSTQFVVIEITDVLEELYDSLPSTEAWAPLRALAGFHRHPTAASAARFLKQVEIEGWAPILLRIRNNVVWPLLSALQLLDGASQAFDVSARMEAGDFGDIDDWKAAELRWSTSGITEADLMKFASGPFFGSDIATVGLPQVSYLGLTQGQEPVAPWVDVIMGVLETADSRSSTTLARMVEFALSGYRPETLLDIPKAIVLLRAAETLWSSPVMALSFSSEAQTSPEVRAALASRAENGRLNDGSERRRRVPGSHEDLVAGTLDEPGLLLFMLNLIGRECLGEPTILEAAKANADHDSERIASAANTLLILAAKHDDDGRLGPILAESPPRYGIHHLFTALQADHFSPEVALTLATALVNRLAEDPSDGFAKAIALLFRFADQRRSDLSEEACWRRLDLRGTLCRPAREPSSPTST